MLEGKEISPRSFASFSLAFLVYEYSFNASFSACQVYVSSPWNLNAHKAVSRATVLLSNTMSKLKRGWRK